MARNLTGTSNSKQASAAEEDKDLQDNGEAATPGIEVNTTMPGDKYVNDAVIRKANPPPKTYEVMNVRPVPILYNGYHATLQPGKQISETAFDIAALKRQGVKLQLVGGEEEAAAAVAAPLATGT